MAVLRLLIIADDPLARAGLALMLAQEADFAVIGQINCVDAADELTDGLRPDVIIWDAGWELSGQLPEWVELGVPIVGLLPPFLPEDTAVSQLWHAGITVLLTRQADGAALAAAARAALYNLTVLDNELAALLLPFREQENEEDAADAAVAESLTPREKEVLYLLAEGLTNKAIARELHISEHTIKFHVNAIMGKLNAQSRTDAVVRATRLGILAL